jgi:glucose-6-phosphate-specific signal transduction histidine kinase
MSNAHAYQELLYQYEILRARLEIREHYLKTIVKEVYENIGQVLSLVRVQLTLLDPCCVDVEKERIDSSGKLVGSAIRDLRSMCQRFQPEATITGMTGFSEALGKEIKNGYPDVRYCVKSEAAVKASLDYGKTLILFSLLLAILNILRENENRQLVAVDVNYSPDSVTFSMEYTGEPFWLNRVKHDGGPDPAIAGRIKLLSGSLQLKSRTTGKRKIKLVIPIN